MKLNRPIPCYMAIARALVAIENCKKSGNAEWQERHENRVRNMCDELPSGGGFDSGCNLVAEECTAEKLVFQADFHHMNNAGMYDGWSNHQVIVTPSLGYGFHIRVTGRDRNDIKAYIADVFSPFLDAMIQEYADEKEPG